MSENEFERLERAVESDRESGNLSDPTQLTPPESTTSEAVTADDPGGEHSQDSDRPSSESVRSSQSGGQEDPLEEIKEMVQLIARLLDDLPKEIARELGA